MDEPKALESARPAFEKHNEEQLTVVKLPGSGENVSMCLLWILDMEEDLTGVE